MSGATPTSAHKKHRRPDVEMGDCWECGRGWAVCRSKRRFDSVEAAHAQAIEVSVKDNWMRPVVAYRCPYCTLWHMTTAKTPARRKRAERTRRKWLLARMAESA